MTSSLLEKPPMEYLTPCRPGFWAWEDGSIALAGGPTLTFREELLTMMHHLQPYGLPPVESLLLFLAALRDPWSESGGLEAAWRRSLSVYDPVLLAHHLPDGWEERIVETLSAVRTLDASWRRERRKKGLLAVVCFEHCQTLMPPEHARGVEDLLEMGFVAPSPLHVEPDEAACRLAFGLRPLLEGFPRLGEARLETRLRSGLDVLPGDEAPAEQALALQVRSLLADLEDDAEWSGLARLARHLMAAVHVPRALGDPEDLPLGGFSDITNRGSLDRLLVSELAQDDLVLSARLALNEALYLRRESPPRTPQESRLLLLDNGLRLWGIPRLFAAAVALAMEAMAERGTQVAAYVPTGHQQLCEVRLHTREGLLEALSHLHPHAHPGNALLELAQRRREHHGVQEMIVITHSGVLRDPAFSSVTALIEEPFYLATVDRTGGYAFYRCCQKKRRLLSRAKMSLEGLMGHPDEAARLRRLDVPAHLPAIFHEQPFPLRLPFTSSRDSALFTRTEGIYKICRDGRLLHFDDPNRGGMQICDDLPSGKTIPVVQVQAPADERRVVVLMSKKRLQFSLIHPESGGRETFVIAVDRPPLQVLVVFQHLLVIYRRRITMHGIGHGEQLGELELPGKVERCCGELILLGGEWQRVSTDGMRPCIEAVDQEGPMKTLPMDEHRLPRVESLRKHFRGVGFCETKLVLFPRRSGRPVTPAYDKESATLHFRPLDVTMEPRLFRLIGGPGGSRIVLKEAAWPDGSRVILDSRGLLHFVSASPDVEEFTLILAQAKISAWLGPHGNTGDPYFFSEPPSASAEMADHLLRQFVLQLLRSC